MSTATLPALLQSFFTERLLAQRHASAHTIASYRDCFRLCRSIRLGLGLFAVTWLVASSHGCGSQRVCTPGETQLCNGPGACQGSQVCNADGTGFGECDCGPSGVGGTGGTNGLGGNSSGGGGGGNPGSGGFGGSGGNETLTAGLLNYATAWCDQAFACGCVDEFATKNECVMALHAYWTDFYNGVGLTYDSGCMAQYIAQIAEYGCNDGCCLTRSPQWIAALYTARKALGRPASHLALSALRTSSAIPLLTIRSKAFA